MRQLLLFMCGSALFFSCKKNNNTPPQPTVVKEFTLNVSAKNENPAPAGRNETGVFVIKIMSDNSVEYNITVSGLASTDALTAAHIHTGNPVTNGGVILNFTPVFSGSTASGTVKDVRTTLLDSIKNETVDLYVNVHSSQVGSGLVRAQINKTVEWTQDVALAGSNEVPAVTTTATGTSRFRLTSDGNLYYIVNVTGLTTGDGNLTAAHIHNGATGANGSVLVALASGAADFGIDKKVLLTDVQKTAITGTAVLYVNAHSSTFPAGLLRGQIR